jgi:hypothetical protein
MALVLADRVRESTNTAGTGTVTLTGAVTGFASFAEQIGDGNTTYYTITDATSWEVGVGTYSANTLSRDTVLDSSNAGAKINFAVGLKDVFVTLPAEKVATTDTLGTMSTQNADNVAITGGSISGVSGLVTSVTGTAPVVSSGGTTPAISMAAATTSVSGYLTSTDWNNFNNKGSGSITSVATAGTVNGITLTGGPITTTGTVTLGGTLDLSSPPAIGATAPSSGAFTYGSTNSTTNTTPALSYNASNSAFVNGATVAGSYLQNVMQNKSSAANSSTNFAVSNNLGTDSTYYGEFGMNSSGFSSGTPSDFFSINNGIYFSGHDGDLSIGSGNGFKTYITWGTAGDKAHVVNASGAIGLNTNITGTSNFGTSGQVLTSAGSAATPTWTTTGTVTSVSGTGTVNGLSLSGTVTNSGNLTFGGTLDLSSPPAIGGTAAAAGTFTTLIGGGGSANYEQITGGATTKAVQFQSLGSDAAVSLAIQSKGTGAIDLAAGSSGVNISNGGTVTALTRTSIGSGYTGFPSIAISAPTTAGGVQATATPQLVAASGTVVSGGSGYTLNDVLTVTTSGGSSGITLTVTGVSGGVVTTASANSSGLTTIPSGTVSVSGGTGSGATFNLLYVIGATITITAAGSGYVEQPTVTFSGGGGSGAAAYATVGGTSVFRGLGATTNFANPAGNVLTLFNPQSGTSTVSAVTIANGGTAQIYPSATGGDLAVSSNGTGNIRFLTAVNSYEQLRVSNTTSAVNYVQVTGGVTGNPATVTASAQGSDANVNMRLTPKGTGTLLTATAATILDGTAIPAGGTAGAGYKLSSTANFGIFFGSGAPTLAAAKGSLYMRSDGSSTATRMYINTDGSTTWTNVVTAA